LTTTYGTDAGSSLPAGKFSEWLRSMRSALAGGEGMNVACGNCVGCCTSSYLIKIRAHEAATLRHVRDEHLAPVPGAGNGAVYLSFDELGACPMFDGGGCSIYSSRPETCRTYDCRVFTAAGLQAGKDKPVINDRIARWAFEYPTAADAREQRAVTAAANFLRQHPVAFPGGRVPSRASEIAVLAVKTYQVFLDPPPSDTEIAAAIVAASREFDKMTHTP
jgi:Fe-S-cluster containining protein